MRYEVTINCLKHGEVPFTATSNLGAVATKYCPLCEQEAHHQYQFASSPYPLQGTSPSVIPELNRGD